MNKTVQDKKSKKQRKSVRFYSLFARRKDDPTSVYGGIFWHFKKGGCVTIFVKDKCLIRCIRSGAGKPFRNEWNEMVKIARYISDRGRSRRKVRVVSKPPILPFSPGSYYEYVETAVMDVYRRVYIATLDGNGNLAGKKRMPIENYDFFTARIWSKNCPIELSPEDDRSLRAYAESRPSANLNLLKNEFRFTVKKDFKWDNGRTTQVCQARGDHELRPVESETQGGHPKPVNQVAPAVNVSRLRGIQNLCADEMRKGESRRCSGDEGETRTAVRNSESAPLSSSLLRKTR